MAVFSLLLLLSSPAPVPVPAKPPAPSLIGTIPWSRYYPPEARRAGIGGKAVIDCVVGDEGYLEDCKIVAETPEGYGFGEQALTALQRHARIDPRALKPGQRVRQPFVWKAPD